MNVTALKCKRSGLPRCGALDPQAARRGLPSSVGERHHRHWPVAQPNASPGSSLNRSLPLSGQRYTPIHYLFPHLTLHEHPTERRGPPRFPVPKRFSLVLGCSMFGRQMLLFLKYREGVGLGKRESSFSMSLPCSYFFMPAHASTFASCSQGPTGRHRTYHHECICCTSYTIHPR